MLRKLLKYDMKPVARIWWIVAVSALGLFLTGSLAWRFYLETIFTDNITFLSVIAMMFGTVCFIGAFASTMVTQFLIYWRFYKNFFTDEGYLTFTLPVSRQKLLLSKTINALIWSAADIGVMVLGILLLMLIVPPTEGLALFDTGMFQALGGFIKEAWTDLGGWLILYVFEAILALAVSLLFSVGLFHMCITIGAMIAKKAKLLAAIGIYYLVNMVLSLSAQVFSTFGLSVYGEGFSILLSDAAIPQIHGAITLVVLLFIVIIAVLSCIMHFLTMGFLERKLNLA